MNPYSRIIVGYHGCSREFADALISGRYSTDEWAASKNGHDWLGHGIYFWEHAPARALQWAEDKARETGWQPAVVGALIQLGRCFDLTEVSNTRNLREAHRILSHAYAAAGKKLPRNKGRPPDYKGRYLDCLVINYYLREVAEMEYQTVRCAFSEGGEAYDGAMLMEQTHVQVAVRDRACILGVFRPTYGM